MGHSLSLDDAGLGLMNRGNNGATQVFDYNIQTIIDFARRAHTESGSNLIGNLPKGTVKKKNNSKKTW
jgi:hypothetical protein